MSAQCKVRWLVQGHIEAGGGAGTHGRSLGARGGGGGQSRAADLTRCTALTTPSCLQSGEAKADSPYCHPSSLVADICGPDDMGGVSLCTAG